MKKVIPYKHMTTETLEVVQDLTMQMCKEAALTTSTLITLPVHRQPSYRSHLTGLNDRMMKEYSSDKVKSLTLLRKLGVFRKCQIDLGKSIQEARIVAQVNRDRLFQVYKATSKELDKRGFDKLIEEGSPAKLEFAMRTEHYKLTKNGKHLCINGHILSTQDANSVPTNLIEHLLEHPYKRFSSSELAAVGIKTSRHFSSIVHDLGFHGSLAQGFFETSKTSIMLRNPLRDATLKELGISNSNFEQEYQLLEIRELFPRPTMPRR